MTTARTLQPEDQVAHYRVVGPLGAGGMGEVYLAQDQTLERNVAIKILPPELIRNEDRVRRFVQEAKSASSLNHPNIVTIYEIGQDEVKSSSGETTTGPVQYISMELVSGKTLGAKIHEEKTDLRTLLGYLAQAAEGISKAHAAGIVHRDLKPGNIMVSDDGFAKVLDFGLAKLTEKRGDGMASATAMTEIGDQTSEGTILGSVHYMSPEQVQAKSVDHRSDIFSFGCILYEAATRRRPFIADSNIETMHKIINEKPQPIEEIDPSIPTELRRLIRRCLNKAPDQRLQSMKDVAIELREIADEYDSLSASATSSSGTSPMMPLMPARRSRMIPVMIGVGAIVVAAVAFGVWGLKRGGNTSSTQPFESMHMTPQTNRGDVTDCALSPDGRYLGYVAGRDGRFSLHVRQVATGGDVELIPTQDGLLESPAFSPDDNYVFFLKRKPDAPSYRTLMSIPLLGGAIQEHAFDVDSRITFSPDGKQACFLRGVPQEGLSRVFILDLDTGKTRELASVRQPELVSASLSWSPDGKRIAAVISRNLPKIQSTVAMFDPTSGERKDAFTRTNAIYNDMGWLRDGSGLALAGQDLAAGINSQVFVLTYPDAQVRRVTNDFNAYAAVTSGGDVIAAVRSSQLSNIFVTGIDGGTVRSVTSSTSPENSPLNFTTTDGHVIYIGIRDRHVAAWSVPVDGGETIPISAGNAHMINVHATSNLLFFNRLETGQSMHVWRVNVDGTDAKQITSGAGEFMADVSLDGSHVTYSPSDSTRGVWVVGSDGANPILLSAAALRGTGFFSPDGARVLVLELGTDAGGLIQTLGRVLPTAGGDPIATVPLIQQAGAIAWTPDGNAVSYIDRSDPAYNVCSERIGETAAKKVTSFTDGRILQFAWARDGKHLIVVRRIGSVTNAWVTAADGSQPKQITNFSGEQIFNVRWMPDNERIAVQAGTASSDAVVIRDFR
jgi:eukaryotic-like serine/threonine-protein kinase